MLPTLSTLTQPSAPSPSQHQRPQKQIKQTGKEEIKLSSLFEDDMTVQIENPEEYNQKSNYVSEKVMAPHSSTLAWKIPWMEEPGGLQSMGS